MRSWIRVLVGLSLPCCGEVASLAGKTCEGESGVVRAAITYGEPRASLLGLAESQERAVVAILELSGEDVVSVCSGVVLDPHTVLTAKHCVDTQAPLRVVVGENTTCPEGEVEVVESRHHPELDLALLTLAEDVVETFGTVPLVVDELGRYTPGDAVQIAGFGLDGVTNQPGRRLFAATSLTEIGPTFLSVRAQYGLTGSCSGDSGGPLLVRDTAGRAGLIGVLSKGASDCVGEDHYVHLENAAGWLPSTPPVGVSVPCGGLDERGACFYGVAQRCAEGQLITDVCAGGKLCVWTMQGFFGCGEPASSSCGATTQLGECQGETAITCNAGELKSSDCNPGQCARSPSDGVARCIDLPK
jgi:hypothetical protein